MAAMPLVMHIAILGLLVLDLIVGATIAQRFVGGWAATGFEFLLILGYVVFVLQWGVPWANREGDDR